MMTTRKPVLDYSRFEDTSDNRTGQPRTDAHTEKPTDKNSSTPDVGLPLSWKDYINCFPVLPSFVKLIKNGSRSERGPVTDGVNLYVHAVRSSGSVIAEELRATSRRRVDSAGHLIEPAGGPRMVSTRKTYSVSFEYRGWFEILSQDGRAVRALDSIKKLVHVSPKRCLVRQTIVGYRRLDESGRVALEPTRVVETGTMLRLIETKMVVSTTRHVSKRRQLLVCLDEQQEEVYFELDQRGLFYPVAGANDITGVHDVQSILTKFRLPVIVRLVGGNLPHGSTGMFRIVTEKRDNRCFALALEDTVGADGKLIHLSTLDRSQTFVPSSSHKKIVDDAFSAQLERRCGGLINDYFNSFHSVSSSLATTTDGTSRFTKRNLTDSESTAERGRHNVGASGTVEIQTISYKMLAESEEDKLLKEIEDIYMSVRGYDYAPPQTFALAASRGVAAGGIAESKLQYKGYGGRPTNVGVNTISYASNVPGRNHHRPTGERRPVQQSHSFKKNLSGQISNRLTLHTQHPWGSSDDLRNMDKSLRERPQSSQLINNNFAGKQLISSEEQLNNSKILKQLHNERQTIGGIEIGLVQNRDSHDPGSTPLLLNESRGRQLNEVQLNQLRHRSRDAFKPHDNVYEEINKFQKSKPKPNLTDDVKSIKQQQHQQIRQQQQPQQENGGRLFSVGDTTNVWSSSGFGQTGARKLTRPKSYAGTTAWEDYIIQDIDDIDTFAPPVPQRRSDSLVNVNVIVPASGASHWLTSSAELETNAHVGRVGKASEESGGARLGTKVSSTAEKFSVFSRALVRAFRRFGNRSTRTLVVTDDDELRRWGAEQNRDPTEVTGDPTDVSTDVFNEESATAIQGHIVLKENTPYSSPTMVQ